MQGTGKTTAGIWTGVNEQKLTGKKIITNLHLNMDFQKFNLEWFVEHLADHEMEDCILLLDEMYQIADSRSSQSKLNKLFTYFVVQTRKRDVDMYVCTHHIDHIDLRLRRALDVRGACRYYEERPCKKCRCKRCGGTGLVNDIRCPECAPDMIHPNQGTGGTGLYQGKPCERCLGYGVIGVTNVAYLDRRIRRRYSIPILGNEVWHLFSTKERIPMQVKILQGIDTQELSYT